MIDGQTGTLSEYYSDVDVLVITEHGHKTARRETEWHRLEQKIANHAKNNR